jgi:carbonic anhydrase
MGGTKMTWNAGLPGNPRVLGITLCTCMLFSPIAAGADTHAGHAAPAALTAQAALEKLVEGNRRFVAGAPKHVDQSAAHRHELTAGQHPFATVLGCSDSRVPVELLFDQGFGDLFVIRVAGNVVGMDDLGSIEYAVHHLHTPLIVVMGHENCGAVTSALLSAEDRSHEAAGIQELLKQIEPALKDIDPALSQAERVHRGVEANVLQSVRQLEATADLMKPHEGVGPMIVGAVYELDTGKIRLLK